VNAADVAIRSAHAGDLDAIHAIEVASFSDPWKREGFRDLMLGGSAAVVVAESDGELVGFAVTYVAAGEAEIANVAVAKDARRRGVGRALVDFVISAASAAGATVVFLEVRESNAAARALYAMRGFMEVSRRKQYYEHPREDAVVMRLGLAER
jgi:ribosomal-protein-alanine N-acetyltransferase